MASFAEFIIFHLSFFINRFVDVETSILNGKLIKRETGDVRGIRYTVHGLATDGVTLVGTVGRFTETGRYLIITVYEVTRQHI